MLFDYSFSQYEALCKALSEAGYRSLTMQEYLAQDHQGKIVVLRHDIDHTIHPGVDMAELEHRYGIRSTFYVRYKKHILDLDAIRRIEGLGHEIGFHYETLDKAGGDYKQALHIFEEELRSLRQMCGISTIAMHGNPLSRLNNRDLWNRYDFRKYGLAGEAYLSIDFNRIAYFSDSGRSWDDKYKIHDYVVQDGPRPNVRNTDELIGLIRQGKLDSLYILVHPIIWTKNLPVWYKELVRLNIVKAGKMLIRLTRGSDYTNLKRSRV